MIGSGAVLPIMLLLAQTHAQGTGQLTFQDRVRAQEAIERFYYSHQMGATRPLEQAVTHEILENKVRRYLQRTRLVETLRGSGITQEELSAELARIASHTGMPNRLLELYAALGNDPVLIEECLVRPLLVERLIRDDSQRRSCGGQEPRVRPPAEDLRLPEAQTVASRLDPIPTPSQGMLSPTCVPVRWESISSDGAPLARSDHTAVWTGNLMIVWGGIDGNSDLTPGGGVYDPLTDSWSTVSMTNAPGPRWNHAAVWTGSEMVVWGGIDETNSIDTGGRYDPISDSWQSMSTSNAPAASNGFASVWTGSRFVVWGGSNGSPYVSEGGQYDPATDTWYPMTTLNAPTPRAVPSVTWTGSLMLIWGGVEGDGLVHPQTGGRYDPISDIWTPMSTTDAPAGRIGAGASWTGTQMLIWGGAHNAEPIFYDTGGVYDPATDTWGAVSSLDAPSARYGPSSVWTGDRVVMWGGTPGIVAFNSTGIYDPATAKWTSATTVGAPAGRSSHTAIWTGNSMIVWGGYDGFDALDSGGMLLPGDPVDADNDGVTQCAGDCDDTDPTVIAVPTEVPSLQWLADRVTLSWTSPTTGAEAGTAYDVEYGDLFELVGYGYDSLPSESCLANDLHALQVMDTSPSPMPGQGWFFLVRAQNSCGGGRYQHSSDGRDRVITACP